MLGRADPPAATEGVELHYQQVAYSSFLNIQPSSVKKSPLVLVICIRYESE